MAEKNTVRVYIYDISKGLAKALSQSMLGKFIPGIWHTGIVVFGKEFYFGSFGIDSITPGGTMLGPPDEIVVVGETEIPESIFYEFLCDLGDSSFKPEKYHLFDHNCNTFSDEVSSFLTGNRIPKHITGLPHEVLSTPLGAMLRPFVDQMSVVSADGAHRVSRENLPGAHSGSSTKNSMPKRAAVPADDSKNRASPKEQLQRGAAQKKTVPGPVLAEIVTFKDEKLSNEFATQLKASLSRTVSPAACSDVERQLFAEVNEFLTTNDCNFSIGPVHIKLLGRLLHSDGLAERSPLAPLAGRLLQNVLLSASVRHLLSANQGSSEVVADLASGISVRDGESAETILKISCNYSSFELGRRGLLNESANRRHATSRFCSSQLLEMKSNEVAPAIYAFVGNLAAAQEKFPEEFSVELGSALAAVLMDTTRTLTEQQGFQLLSALWKCMDSNCEIIDLVKVIGVDVTSSPIKDWQNARQVAEYIAKMLK